MTAVAASGIVAMSALTGCLGKDDKKAASSSSSSSATASADATASGKSTDSPAGKPSGSSTGTKKPGTANPSASSDKVNRIDLKVGDCVNFEGEKMSKTSCTGPHAAETVGVYTMPSTMSPTSLSYQKDIEAKCSEYGDPVIKRQPNADKLNISFVYPTASSWIMDNDKTLQCFVGNDDNSPMPAGKLK
ncbi:hypothetical protein [Yinghuangia seranimata]|uniref:hypothetical protein n=1 Tax=Yinghuangia seranimata TaxID=408067 RepID=UPI00248CD745|nr:hypothetical protein [Yinghuangia seranimata]MDI2129782.1 hypothetical protein [Yinghuangia seranimata]